MAIDGQFQAILIDVDQSIAPLPGRWIDVAPHSGRCRYCKLAMTGLTQMEDYKDIVAITLKICGSFSSV
jgi:hypothetical protein